MFSQMWFLTSYTISFHQQDFGRFDSRQNGNRKFSPLQLFKRYTFFSQINRITSEVASRSNIFKRSLCILFEASYSRARHVRADPSAWPVAAHPVLSLHLF